MAFRFERHACGETRGSCETGTGISQSLEACGTGLLPYHSHVRRPHRSLRQCPRLAAIVSLLIALAWAVPASCLRLYPLRELLRLGESTGITPPARLGGQILGFNFVSPPAWYHLVALTLSAAIALAPALLPALWLRLRLASGRRDFSASTVLASRRALLALLAASAVYATLDRLARDWLWNLCVSLGVAIGGQVSHIGLVAVGPDGPFFGGGLLDNIGNLLTRYGPDVAITLAAAIAAVAVHSLLWRADLLAAAAGHLCPHCGYDLSATPAGAPCPECGRAGGDPGSPASSAHTRASAPRKLHT
jgi:hypothetical protein